VVDEQEDWSILRRACWNEASQDSFCAVGGVHSISASKISARLQGEDAPVTRVGIY
jgi:hypothetical protein